MSSPPFRFSLNPFRRVPPSAGLLPPASGEARAFHRALPGYAPTPLVPLAGLARELGLRNLWLKDESKRFGLNAFKALGASYAIYRHLKAGWSGPPLSAENFLSPEVISRVPTVTFTSATDGNHGRAVAWTAAKLRQKAVIYVPGNTVRSRIEALEREGAQVVVVDGTYDDAVARAARDAETHGRQIISDTAWEGYTQIPAWIMEGYGTLFEEIDEQLPNGEWPGVVLLQAGVGGLAYAGAVHFLRRQAERGSGNPVRLVCVEPLDADCLLESIRSPEGTIQLAKGRQNSIMAGLNCGTPSLAAWPLLREAMDAFLAVDDEYAREAMRLLSRAEPRVVSGESGAAGLAGLLAGLHSSLGLGPHSDVLLVSTEGATDPESYQRIVGRAP